MFLFPLIYLCVFAVSLYAVLKGNQGAVLLYIIFGLPIYITVMSITFMYGLGSWIPFLQVLKEASILITFTSIVLHLHKKIKFHLFDWLIIVYAVYNLLYLLLPVGIYTVYEKLVAFKNISFFSLIYFTGRFIQVKKVNFNITFVCIAVLQVAGAIILFTEISADRHFQTLTGYADYNYAFFDAKPTGSYGLTNTFEADNGIKRFASFFAHPLEHAAVTLVTLSILCAVAIQPDNKFKLNKLMIFTLLCTLFSVTFALSRASLASFFIELYVLALVTRKTKLVKTLHIGFAAAIIVLFLLKGDLVDYAIDTLTFNNGSSMAHVISWLEGIQAIGSHPLGLGLGASGRVGAAFGLNIGGENEPIIIGVQTGIIAMLLYLVMYIYMLAYAFRRFRHTTGKSRRIALFILLLKIGLIIPMLTAEIESYAYITYITWFFTGLLVNLEMSRVEDRPFVKQKTFTLIPSTGT